MSAHTINAIRASEHDAQPVLFAGTGNAPATWATLSAAYGWRSACAHSRNVLAPKIIRCS